MNILQRAFATLALFIFGSVIALPAQAAQTQLSDQPLFSPLPVPGNLLLTLSVEYPTADSTGYPTSSAYSTSTLYQGYFDPTKCYTYQYNSSNVQQSYFAPYSIPTAGSPAVCTSTSSAALWSGNFLNWATMSTVDPFRWALTGGYRSAIGATVKTGSSSSVAVTSGDTAPTSSAPAFTILERAWQSVGQGTFGNSSGDDFPDHVISGASTIAGATPFQGISCLVMRSGGMGNLEYFTGSVATASTTANACTSESGNFDSGNGDAAGSNPSGDCYGGTTTTTCTSSTATANPALNATGAATASASGVVYYNGGTYNVSSSTNYSNSANYGDTSTTTITGVTKCPSSSDFKNGTPSTCKVSGTTYNCLAVTYSGTTYSSTTTTYSSCAYTDTTSTTTTSACAWSSSWTSTAAANLCAGTGGTSGYSGVSTGTIYEIAIRTQVCDPTLGGTTGANVNNLESNCVAYTPVSSSGTLYDYKPQGLMQQYATQIDYGVFGYMDDPTSGGSNNRDGAVLRSNMKFIGGQIPVPGGTSTTNANNEWSTTTGVYIANPNPTDVTNTNTACKTASGSSTACASYSGVLNYLNGFGETLHRYKSNDNVGELYYAGIRYYKNLGNVPNWSSFTATGSSPSSSTVNTYTDGFPVITTWNDPIQYACQKNFILGIGDVNTHADGDVPNNPTFDGDSNEPAWTGQSPTVKSALTAAPTDPVNTEIATNAVGFMEKNDSNDGTFSITTSSTGLGDTAVPWCCGDGNTFDMAGLAYDAHVTDMRPNSFTTLLNPNGSKAYTQTVSTFWLDVQEYQTFRYQNQFWLAAKYGGFTVPAGYSEYGSAKGATLGTTTTASPTDYSVPPTPASSTAFTTATLPSLSLSSWYTTSRTQVDSSGNTDKLPDNYFPASNATAMVNGLSTAFSNIVSQSIATTTAFSTVKPQVTTSGNTSFSASYDPGTWTGSLIANSLSFSGTSLTPVSTQVWNAQTTLETKAAANSGLGWKNRVIITNSKAPASTASAATGVLLSSGTLTSAATSALTTNCPDKSATNCINYLSGDRSNEGASGTASYRVRTFLLGDIADSQTTPVGPPNQPFSSAFNPGYSSFVSAHSTRPLIVYVGANDGMLHAFDGSLTDGTNGLEYFAYMPSFGFQGPGSGSPGLNDSGYSATPNINGLPSYGNKAFVHHFFVDATPVVADVDFANTSASVGGSGNWHSVLIGGLGKGGAGYYALDVTDPTGVASSPGPVAHQLSSVPTSSNANPSKVLLWEFTDSDAGYSYGEPTIVKTKQYGWVALLTTGYNNPDGIGMLYVVDVSTGKLLETISTANTKDTKATIGSSSNPAGLAWVSGFTANYQDDTIDYAYAGDLFGQVWRFDLTGNTPPTSCTATGGCPVLLATLADSSGNAQPITTRPLVELDPGTNNRYVLVGTGQELGANDLTTTSQQAFYVIQDGTIIAPFPSVALTTGCTGTTIAAGAIPCGGILGSGLTNASTNFTTGTSATNTPVTTTTGFFFNLNSGYRVNTTPSVNGDDVLVTANQPTGGVCQASGSNETYAFAFAGAGAGTSLLTSTSGSQIPYAQGTGAGVNTNILNVSGTDIGLVGTDINGLTNVGGNFNPTPTFKLLNWQEVNPSN